MRRRDETARQRPSRDSGGDEFPPFTPPAMGEDSTLSAVQAFHAWNRARVQWCRDKGVDSYAHSRQPPPPPDPQHGGDRPSLG